DGNQEKAKRSVTLPAAGFVLLMILMYCTVHFHHNPLGTFTTFSAWYYLQNDEAAWYYEECMQRMQVLESSRGQDVVLTAHAHQPWLFFIEDISEDPGYWLNAAMSSYYGVATVRLESSEE
nr:hypothetical protein [Lachnospiraceae bacterium]